MYSRGSVNHKGATQSFDQGLNSSSPLSAINPSSNQNTENVAQKAAQILFLLSQGNPDPIAHQSSATRLSRSNYPDIKALSQACYSSAAQISNMVGTLRLLLVATLGGYVFSNEK
ncbi:uncharacterized protein PGTG_09741 [Puccinia graminis f. sp. tritici CRL 75-36-700-3]|uniref:Uncharacterized protein n=1 Tax=Puccinia graminis f. sp. tritici (strain CRL 75-36-700-3 / race SCCL) TaxID=418459 RepID=E3KIA3_PUCGT|nr:uncharacterized protein PGTG_09741 [Puccinia graminis f. sp. tritici CRL 75-36-700-3]EFP84028.2 hypothetical protein PGTG_09741 [Puccinia graminis f. sp. tritici CRL 75-36-700-3]